MAFTGQLRTNEIFAGLFNMIISQEVFADNFADNYRLVDKARVDGSMYGDTKLYYSADILSSREWGKDSATNILELERPKGPETQAIYLDQFRQIGLTVDNYLTKRAWATEGAFTSFNAVMLSMINETKKIHEGTLYNVFIGTTKAVGAKQNIEWAISTAVGNATGLEAAKLEATEIGRKMADLLVELKDYSRDFNDYGHMRSYSEGSIKVVWNSSIYNKIRKVDLPTIFHKEGIIDKFDSDVLPARYFGKVLTSTDAEAGGCIASNHVVADKGVRSRVERTITVSSTEYHVFPGDLIPAGASVGGSSAQFTYAETYKEDSDIICKILIKWPPFMSAFQTGTNFFNPKSLTETHWLTWGYNTLTYLKNYPLITVTKTNN